MRKDEVRTSESFTKYMMYTNSTDCGKYILYEFTDESGNIGLHYQLKLELLENKKQVGQARLWQTKLSKLNKGDIAIVVCCCREVLEPGYNQSAMYLNVDKIISRLVKYDTIIKDYRGVPTEYVIEHAVRDWEDIRR